MQIADDDDEWICPSFNSYSISAKVAGEAAGGDLQLTLSTISENDKLYLNDQDDDEDNLEFAFTLTDQLQLSNNHVNSSFPIFNRELIFEHDAVSSSSSEHEEMDSIPPGTYCVWKPKLVDPSPTTCKKSKSTGFGSKRWNLRDLLRRSNSDGKDSYVFLTPKRKDKKLGIESQTLPPEIMEGPTPVSGISKAAKPLLSSKKSTTTKGSSSGLGSGSPTRRMIYTPANRDIMRGNETPNRSQKRNGEIPKRKSYLPYRQDLVGFFTTVNSLGRNFSQLKMK